MSSNNQTIEDRLVAHPFLKGMAMEHIKVLARSAVPTHFEKDQVIFKAGEPANGFYLIETGSVALEGSVHEHGPITTDVVSSGEPLGWSWLFEPYLWHYDARASESVTAIFFDRLTLRKSCDEDLTLGHELFRRMSQVMVQRLQSARAKLIEARHKTDRAK
jgi:CRP/FNR family cyclic AMP-dependent transcriptional regulator